MRTLEAKGLTRPEARDARSYAIGDVIKFAKAYADKGVGRGEALTIKGIDPVKNSVALERSNGDMVDWRPRQWGAAKSEAFTPKEIELQSGDQIAFTRNDRAQGRTNGSSAEVINLDHQTREARIRLDNGKSQTLRLESPADQHIRHSYAQTAHAAQGKTAERVFFNADSKAGNLVDQKLLYVSISRAKTEAVVYTDDRAKLVRVMAERSGEKQVAWENTVQASKSKDLQLG